MVRPYFQAGTKELEALFEQYKDDAEQLVVLLDELGHRSTPKAVTLKDQVERRLAAKKDDVGAPNIAPSPRPQRPRQPELPLETAMEAAGEVPLDSWVYNRGAGEDFGPGSAPKRETAARQSG